MGTKKLKKKKASWTPKYAKGDIVGICSDCMGEFLITDISPLGAKEYSVKCLKLAIINPRDSVLKIGTIYTVPEYRIVVKLGKSGKRWPIKKE